MNLSTICQTATCFENNWRFDYRLAAMMRKFGFLELNKYLKEKDIISRYKRNVELKEVFDSAYSKTVSSMIRDLIESIFTGVDLQAITLEKQRGYSAYNFTLRMPNTQTAFQNLMRDLEALRDGGFLSWTTWRLALGRTVTFQISFANLPVMARHPVDARSSLTVFVNSLDSLAVKVRQLHPALTPVVPVAVDVVPVVAAEPVPQEAEPPPPVPQEAEPPPPVPQEAEPPPPVPVMPQIVLRRIN